MLYKIVGQDLSNYGNNNGSNSIKYSQFICVFINNRSNYFEQFITILEII